MRRLRLLAGLLLAGCILVVSPTGAAAGDLVGQVTDGRRALRNAVVFVADLRTRPISGRAVMDQRNRTFIPHVLAVQVGMTVEFPNSDTIYHNVFSTRDGKPFDLGLYPVGKTEVRRFHQPGLIRLFCNIHSNMSAFIWVVENPYYEVTDGAGRFRIRGVPGGTRVVRVWHERLGSRRLSVAVPAEGDLKLDVRLGHKG